MRLPGLRTVIAGLVGLAVLAGGIVGIRALVSSPQRTAVAYFPLAIHVYPGSDVDVLGVKVGSVQSVTPEGTRVRVVLSYAADQKIPADVSAVVLTPTLVADRVVQLAPVYSGGPVLADGATISLRHNQIPVELDQIDASLVHLTNALGPRGANAHGALSRVLEVGERNLHGQGAHAHTTFTRLAPSPTTARRCSARSTIWSRSPTSSPPTTRRPGPSSPSSPGCRRNSTVSAATSGRRSATCGPLWRR
jgi:phospholipid/cholesterol/gamma-HCH transport system substrate-binding protein